MSFGDDTLDPSNQRDYAISNFLSNFAKYADSMGEEWKSGNPELMDSFLAIEEG